MGKRVKDQNRDELIAAAKSDKSVAARLMKSIGAHLEEGLSLDCYDALSEGDILDLVAANVFQRDWLDKCLRRYKLGWELIGRGQAEGRILGNSRSWSYNMSNRFRWSERANVDTKMDGNLTVNVVSYKDLEEGE